MRFEWQQIGDYTWRAKVLGGWLIKSICFVYTVHASKEATGCTMVFISDKDFEWEIENEN